MTAPAALLADFAAQLERRWLASGEGRMVTQESSLRLLEMQWRPAVQVEAAHFDPRVRAALLYGLDREAVSEVANGGRREAAWSLLPRDDPLYEVTRDSLRRYAYDPDRAKEILREGGWAPGAGGLLRNGSDGRPFRTSVWVSAGRGTEGAAIAGHWRDLGMEVEEFVIPAARGSDREFRASFAAWYGTGTSVFDQMAATAATAETAWLGNSNGFEDVRAQRLVAPLDSTLAHAPRLQAMRAINDYFVAELPLLPMFYIIQLTAVAKGVKAFDDIGGAEGSERIYGSYARNAHLWDVEQ
jgi:peptide/nickel transport system substrate-binding protein